MQALKLNTNFATFKLFIWTFNFVTLQFAIKQNPQSQKKQNIKNPN